MTKRFCLTLAAGALLAAIPAAAQQPVTTYPATSGTVVSTPAFGSTAVYGSPTVVTSDDTTTVRRGLFARLRARREARSATTPTYGPVVGSPVFTSSQYAAPTITTTPGTVITPAPATAPPPSVPMQMPGRMSMMMPAAGMQTVMVEGMAYTVPATLPPEGVVISERIINPTDGGLDRNVIWPASGTMTTMPGQVQNLTFRYVGPTVVTPASGTVVVPGTVTPATYTIPLQPMPRPR